MEYSLNDLYLKYANSIGPAVEDDRYFQYLFESIQAGDQTLEQKSQVLRKVVDEEWLTTIENALDSVYKVVDNPRRFIKTTEEIVPVGLAKKITADSVRHLSQNTQFIASNDNGDIQPTKILNITSEDTYDLYENRFIYHLIQRLVAFIDKRTDVIFWSTGDETRDTLTFESKVDDAYEQIEYKVEMKITNRQSNKENDSDNMDVFMRIDRVRRLVMALRHSSFCEVMAGCTKVRSPIQRTNLIMKDPDYRNCYSLWQFLERYDAVGYSIVEEDKALEMDEEYLFQLYTNYIGNYSLFKTITEPDKRDLSTVIDIKRKFRKPKFIKHIREEFVENRDIDVDEVRRVFIEEVTEAQIAAENALAEEQIKTAELSAQLDQAYSDLSITQSMLDGANMSLSFAEEARAAAEAAQAEAEAKAAEAITNADLQIAQISKEAAQKVNEAVEAKKAAEEMAEDEKGRRIDAELIRDKAVEDARAAEEKSEAVIKEAREASEAAIRDAQEKSAAAVAQAEEIRLSSVAAKEAADKAMAEADSISEQAKAYAEETRTTAEKMIAEAKAQAEKYASDAKAEAEKFAADAKADAEKYAADAKSAAEKVSADAQAYAAKADEERNNAIAAATKATEARNSAETKRAQAEAIAEEAKRQADDAIRQSQERMKLAEELIAEANALKAEAEAQAAEAKKQIAEYTELKAAALTEVKTATTEAKEAKKLLEKAERRLASEKHARQRAEERAKEGTLSKYIAQRLSERRNKSEENSDKD